MKVLYFHQYFSTRAGGTGTRSYEMAKALIEAGHEVTMVCANYGPANTGLDGEYRKGRRTGTVDGIRVIEFELPCSNSDGLLKRSLTFLKYSFRSTWTALSERADLVFATSTPLTAAIPGIASRWFRRKPFVFEVRDLWPELPRAMGVIKNPLILFAMSVLERRAYKAATSCIGLAPGIADGIAKHIGMDRVAMVPNGCDLDLSRNDATAPWRPEGVSDQHFMAVFAGTHGPANGLDAVLDAAEMLKELGRDDIRFVLVGDGKQKPELLRQSEKRGLDNIIFVDRVSKEKVAGLLAAADCGMQLLANIPAFYFGTSPNKFFDYLACGLPVLNNYPGWVSELVVEHECGVAIPPQDPEAFAKALMAMCDDREGSRQMGLAARKLAEQQFARPELAMKFVEVLENAAGK